MLIFSESKTADEWVVSKSKFIGHTLMGDSRESFLKDVLEISRKHKTANHVAFAYQIRSNNSSIWRVDSLSSTKPLLIKVKNVSTASNIQTKDVAITHFIFLMVWIIY